MNFHACQAQHTFVILEWNELHGVGRRSHQGGHQINRERVCEEPHHERAAAHIAEGKCVLKNGMKFIIKYRLFFPQVTATLSCQTWPMCTINCLVVMLWYVKIFLFQWRLTAWNDCQWSWEKRINCNESPPSFKWQQRVKSCAPCDLCVSAHTWVYNSFFFIFDALYGISLPSWTFSSLNQIMTSSWIDFLFEDNFHGKVKDQILCVSYTQNQSI